MCHIWVFRQICIARVIQTSEPLNIVRARRVLRDLEKQGTVPAGIGWFIFDRDRDR